MRGQQPQPLLPLGKVTAHKPGLESLLLQNDESVGYYARRIALYNSTLTRTWVLSSTGPGTLLIPCDSFVLVSSLLKAEVHLSALRLLLDTCGLKNGSYGACSSPPFPDLSLATSLS